MIAFSSSLVNFLGTRIMFVGIYFCDLNMLKMVTKFANKSLANINEFTGGEGATYFVQAKHNCFTGIT